MVPFLDTLKCRTILGTQKGTLILTTLYESPNRVRIWVPLRALGFPEVSWGFGIYVLGFHGLGGSFDGSFKASLKVCLKGV